jgi:hypothetical protein
MYKSVVTFGNWIGVSFGEKEIRRRLCNCFKNSFIC